MPTLVSPIFQRDSLKSTLKNNQPRIDQLIIKEDNLLTKTLGTLIDELAHYEQRGPTQ